MDGGEPGTVGGTSGGSAWAQVWRLALVRATGLLSNWGERRLIADDVAAATVEHLLLRESERRPDAWISAELATRLRRIVRYKAQELLRERERESAGDRSGAGQYGAGPNQAAAVEAVAAPEMEASRATAAGVARSQREARRLGRLTPLERQTVARLRDGETPAELARGERVTRRAILRRLERAARRVERREPRVPLRRAPLPILPAWRDGRLRPWVAFAERWNAGATLEELAQEFRTTCAGACQRAHRIRVAARREARPANQESEPPR